MVLTPNFLIYSTMRGSIVHINLDDGNVSNEYNHGKPIRKLWPNPSGTRCVFLDSALDGYFFSPVSDECVKIAKFPGGANQVGSICLSDK